MFLDKINEKYEQIENNIGKKNIGIIYFLITVLLSSGICFLGVYNGHDVKFHLSRVISIADCLKNGTFPAIIYPNYLEGYGYANGAFYPDLFLYIPAILIVLGIKSEIAYNIFLILINITAALTTYLCVKKISGSEFCGLLAGRIMTLSPYYLTDAYVRSALGEHLSFAFLPLVVLGLYNLFYGEYKKGGIIFTLGLVAIVYSHILSILLCALFVIIFGLVNIDRLLKEKERIKYCLIYGFIAVGIGAYVCLPLMEMMTSDTFLYKVNPFSSQNMAPRAVPVYRLFVDYTNDFEPWFPMGIGMIFIVLLVLCIKNIFDKKEKNIFANKLLFIGLLFLIASSSIFPWKYTDILNVLQFPWRFYQIVTLCFSIGFTYYISKKITNSRQMIKVQLILMPFMLLTLMSFGYYTLMEGFDLGFTRNWGYKISEGEYLPADLGGQYNIDRNFGKNYVEERGMIIECNHDIDYSFTKNGSSIVVNYSNNNYEGTYMDLPLIYYKGYVASENGNVSAVQKGDTGLVRVELTDKQGIVFVKYGFTLIRKASVAITMCSAFMLVYYFFKEKNDVRQ